MAAADLATLAYISHMIMPSKLYRNVIVIISELSGKIYSYDTKRKKDQGCQALRGQYSWSL